MNTESRDSADQLELALDDRTEATAELPALPSLALSADTTPGAILAWWDDLVEIFTRAADEAKGKLAPLRAELDALKAERTGEARRRTRRLREEEREILGAAEAVEFAAYGLFEGTLAEFSPQLIQMLQAEGLDIPDDDEMAVAEFRDCLQRPAIEWCAQMPLREIVRHFCAKEPPAS